MKSTNKVRSMTEASMIAAIYVVLVVLFQSISFGPIQFRIAEALTALPYFTPAAIPGVTIGCLLANILGGAHIIDVAVGTLATLIGAIGSYLLRRHKWLVPLPPILANTLLIPYVLRYAYGIEGSLPYFMATVGTGEVIACGVLGLTTILILEGYRGVIFQSREV